MEPLARIIAGRGVVGVLCAACHAVVIVVNAAQVQRDLAELGAAYYTCRACAGDVRSVVQLTADSDGLELLLPAAPTIPAYAHEWAQASGIALNLKVCLQEARAWDTEAQYAERTQQPEVANLARQRAVFMRQAYAALYAASLLPA